MGTFIAALCGWMPTPLLVLVAGVCAIFTISVILRVIAFILDIIPFL